jgi:hypothetical protein
MTIKDWEILTFTLCDGFVNTWTDDDETPVLFATKDEAAHELKRHLADLLDAWTRGEIQDEPNKGDYQINQKENKQ